MLADPWMKFYTSDWRADPRLKMCSPAARGMWIEMICLMHEATPYGHLLVYGQTPNVAQLASLTGIPAAELPDLIGELERLGVFSRTREGVIYSRKLVRMEAKAAVARKNGKNGGNPSLRKQTENQASDNQKDKGGDIPQKPEARSQKPEYSEAVASGDFAADPVKAVFDAGLAVLGQCGVKADAARRFVGKLRKDYPGQDGQILTAIMDCGKAGAVDPIPWITARLAPKKPIFDLSNFGASQ